jgi:FkbM family methyltransferase
MSIKTLLKRIVHVLPDSVRFPDGARISFSQEGEDLILERFFEGRNEGFYIDVGAHHPIRFSNTQLFYLKGWRGVNIDAAPGSMEAFNRLRKRDINIEAAISNGCVELNYYLFNEPALNTFNKERAEFLIKNTEYKLKRTVSVLTQPLSQILASNIAIGQKIDFLTIDAEGLDYEILLSNDWKRFRPYILLIENTGGTLDTMEDSAEYNFLKSLNYEPVARTFNTVFYRDKLKTNP